MAWEPLFEDVLCPDKGDDVSQVVRFLESLGLGYDPHPDVVVVLRTRTEIAGTISLAGRVVKHMGVSPDWQGSGVAAQAFGRIYSFALSRGYTKLFAFTTPGSVDALVGLGFTRIEGTSEAVLLEFLMPGHHRGIGHYEQMLRSLPVEGRVGSVVMNANPFTLGHQHLVRVASEVCDSVVVFVVSEDRSLFPRQVRLRLISEGVSRVRPSGIMVVESEEYIVSQATFPMYFLRRPERAALVQARLDAQVFARRLAPAAGVTLRFVGEEPYCETTRLYNEAMSDVFSRSGIELRIVPRFAVDGEAVSASRVRSAIREDNWDLVSRLVPDTTLSFLRSAEAKPIIDRIKISEAPH